MPEECNHTVGWEHCWSDGEGGTAVHASSVTNRHTSRPDEEFEFCPDCGASLEEFWKPIRYPSRVADYKPSA